MSLRCKLGTCGAAQSGYSDAVLRGGARPDASSATHPPLAATPPRLPHSPYNTWEWQRCRSCARGAIAAMAEMSIRARLTMCPGVVRYRCAGGNGTEVARPATRGRSGEHKPNSHGRASLPPRSFVRMGRHNPNVYCFPYDVGTKVVHALSRSSEIVVF